MGSNGGSDGADAPAPAVTVDTRSRSTSSGFTYSRFMTFLDARWVMLGPRMADGRNSANAALYQVNAYDVQRLSREIRAVNSGRMRPDRRHIFRRALAADAAARLQPAYGSGAAFWDAPAAMAESRSRGTICGFSYERFMTVSYVEGSRYARPKLRASQAR
jgi:hypothetical protein